MQLNIFDGGNALTPFRASALLQNLRLRVPGLSSISARYVHLVVSNEPPTSDEVERISQLLTYGNPALGVTTDASLIVAPRFGTVSPWASKATDIAHNCGLQVRRIERVIEYFFAFEEIPRHLGLEQLFAESLEFLHDRMTESVLWGRADLPRLFDDKSPVALDRVDLLGRGKVALELANKEFGLALSDEEVEYLAQAYHAMGRNPTDVELMMFAQANSEHCRHKIFNAEWVIDGVAQPLSLFQMIRNTHRLAPQHTIIAYSDNAAVMEGGEVEIWEPELGLGAGRYQGRRQVVHPLMKVETHNHPTAISPFPGAATGAGGEIRDEGATGRGSRPKAGLSGFSVSNLRIPGAHEPWESRDVGKPEHIASALQIMIDGPLGGAAFNNEFGRPNLAGYFRVYEQSVAGVQRGYHKPIMIAGGVGSIESNQTSKAEFDGGTLLIQLGGPGMRIGMGGGAASSMAAGSNTAALDFDSVQRGNPEIQRRAHEVIVRCSTLGASNPILAIHDVGAGGLSNAFPELIDGSGRGGRFDITKIPLEERGLAPKEIWCNESQERYVLAIRPESLVEFERICERERCPFAVVGVATHERRLVLTSENDLSPAIDMPMEVLLGKPPRMRRDVFRKVWETAPFNFDGISLKSVATAVLRHPTVASKRFLITIGDRSVGGMSSRDQMVGPWQVPVADCAVTLADYSGFRGEAMSMGERTPLACVNAPASGRMAIGEALTNLLSAQIELARVKLSCNWMAACGENGEDAALFDTVKAVGMEVCPALGISVPVGKDSLSMRTRWRSGGESREVIAPVSLIVSAFVTLDDVRPTLTPQIVGNSGVLVLIDLGQGRDRMGGSILCQVTNQFGGEVPDLDDPQRLRSLVSAINQLRSEQRILAYHDRSDGGLWSCVCEMAFAGNSGIELQLSSLVSGWSSGECPPENGGREPITALFSEELGVVLQVREHEVEAVLEVFRAHNLDSCAYRIARVVSTHSISILNGEEVLGKWRIEELFRAWDEVSWRISRLRDNAECADSEHDSIGKEGDPGLHVETRFELLARSNSRSIEGRITSRPHVAILREQGVNSHLEMSYVMDRAGMDTFDVHMTDLQSGRVRLDDFVGFVACGGFTYGDTLGAGEGWARSILFHDDLLDQFRRFFSRSDTFALGICNGCQMMAALASIIPGTDAWPRFTRNRSEQFEARLSQVEVLESPSIFFKDMAGSRIPIVVSHGEGFADFSQRGDIRKVCSAMRFVDHYGNPTESYPMNPNGSPGGMTGVTSTDGRFTALMPHPERTFRNVMMSWTSGEKDKDSPWMRMFQNARVWASR